MDRWESERHYDKTAAEYESLYDHPYWALYLDITWANIQKYLPEDKQVPILDAGGGTGYWARKLAELGYQVVCSDISRGMLEEGRRKVSGTSLAGRIDFVYSDITNMKESPDENFSLVLSEGDPVGYCGNPQKAISELARVAKRGAYVIVSVDSFFSVLRRVVVSGDLKELERLLDTGDTYFGEIESMQHNFTAEELRRLYADSGLEVVDVIGKAIFAGAIPQDKMEEVLGNRKTRDRIFELELQFNSDPAILETAGHLEIVGRKK